MKQNIIYQATIITNNTKNTYIGLTENNFKTRFNNHKSSFINTSLKNSTELSKYTWELKDKNQTYKITWKKFSRKQEHTTTKQEHANYAYMKNTL